MVDSKLHWTQTEKGKRKMRKLARQRAQKASAALTALAKRDVQEDHSVINNLLDKLWMRFTHKEKMVAIRSVKV